MKARAPDRHQTVLERILAHKRRELAAERLNVPIELLVKAPPTRRRGFRAALESRQPAVISEIKRASPSAGLIAPDFDPAVTAQRYERAGAAALSVLTDSRFFQGALAHLAAARAATSLPLLRKDFTIDVYHVLQASAGGADCVLLIVAALADAELRELLAAAAEVHLDALVEVHDSGELDRALEAGATIVGVNNRNLKTMEVSLRTSLDLARRIPEGILKISESGIRTPDDVLRLRDAGYHGFLIGEGLMRHSDPGSALADLLGAVR
ncbi:MAG: indole-3-glycerol phosphate synthase TrpC [Bryobacterales bacterium]|nr:indole-3-glycerol phosphate synthase TrpC [Bryobacterales bacterium]